MKKAIDHFASSFSPEEKKTVEVCCRLIRFRMSSTVLLFKDRYFEYNVGASIDEKGSAIGGYNSAFLADLVASYLFDLCSNNFYLAKYYGIYRNDRIVVFDSIWMTRHIADWLKEFQCHIKTIAGNAYLVFMASVWTNSPYDCNLDKITVIQGNKFPYLDMEFYWDVNSRLKTRIYQKPNQALKYVSQGSMHTSQCLQAIPHRVFPWLAKLTSKNEKLCNTPVNKIYLNNFQALNNAQLLKGIIVSTMGKIWSNLNQPTNRKKDKYK